MAIATLIAVSAFTGCLAGTPPMGSGPVGETEASNEKGPLVEQMPEIPDRFDNSGRLITATEDLNLTGIPPEEIDIAEYQLTVDGLVERPLALSYDEILAYPTVTKVVLLICPGVFEDNAEWTGVPVATLLAEAGVKPEATEVTFHDFGNYAKTLPLEVAQQEGVFLAYLVNGEVLPLEHGYPLRLVAEGRYGSDWVKWVKHIEVR
jgi:DMSO/TMAO reductase YedYZ molybdopterin-dependent catalytic subunit